MRKEGTFGKVKFWRSGRSLYDLLVCRPQDFGWGGMLGLAWQREEMRNSLGYRPEVAVNRYNIYLSDYTLLRLDSAD